MNKNILSYSDKLRNPLWQKKRLEVMQRDKFTCQLCQDAETELHIHHKEYINGKSPWEYDNSLLVTLCKDCHYFLHDCDYYPVAIIKVKNYAPGLSKPVFFAIGEFGLITGNFPSDTLGIPHNILKLVVQSIINYWLSEGLEYNLNDYKL